MIGDGQVSRQGNWVLFALGASVVALAFLVKDYRQTPFDDLFNKIGKAYGIDPHLLQAFARKENAKFDPYVVTNEPNGTKSYGLMQINDVTAQTYGVTPDALTDPETNITTAARLMNDIKRQLGIAYSTNALISAYNEGVGTFKKRGIVNADYVASVLYHYSLYSVGGYSIGGTQA